MGVTVELIPAGQPQSPAPDRPDRSRRQTLVGRRRQDLSGALDADFAEAMPATFAESVAASFNSAVANDLAISDDRLLRNAYRSYLDQVFEATGQRFGNPMDIVAAPRFGVESIGRTLRARSRAEAEVFENARVLMAEHPDLIVKSPDDIRLEIAGTRRTARETAAEVADRTSGVASAGAFVGQMAAASLDPPVLATLFAGAPASAGILRTAIIEGAVGATVEIPVQLGVQSGRTQFGEDPNLAEGAANVAAAGAGGAVFGAGFKALGLGGRALLQRFDQVVPDPTPVQQAARQAVQDVVDIEAASPLVDALPEHLERLQTALDGLEIDEPPTLTARPVAPVDEAALEAAADNLDGVMFSFAPDELQVDAETFQFKAGADAEGVSDRLAGVTQWDPSKGGVLVVWERADGARFVADGHQRVALAQRLQGRDPAQRIRLFGVMLRESEGVTAEQARAIAAAKNIAEGTGSAVDAAKVLRAGHQDATLPPQSPLVRAARDLTDLSDDAFGMVINELVPAHFAAIVGRMVGEPSQQLAVLDLLAKTEPGNVTEAEAIVRQALEIGFSSESTVDLFGDREIVESLFADRARVLDRSIKRLRRDRTVFNTLVNEQEQIAGAGNVLRTAENQRRATTDAQALQTVQILANRRGPLSDALSAAARRARADGRTTGAVEDFVAAVRGAIARGDLDGIQIGAARRADEIAAQDRARAQQDAALDEAQAEPFAEPAGAGAAEQADQLQAEITEFLAADNLEADFDRLLDSQVRPAAAIAHPLVQDAVDRMAAIPLTNELPDFGTPAFEAARKFTVNGRTVTGYDAAVEVLYDIAARRHAVRQERVAVLVSGPPAAGKSSIAEPAAVELGARVIDPDDSKVILPEYNGGVGANAVHEESALLSARVLTRAVAAGDNIVLPRTGNKIDVQVEKIEQLRALGYKVFVYNMDVDPDVAFERMLRRFRRTGRLVNPDFAREVGSKPTEVYNQLRNGGQADGFKNFDNNGSGPRLVETHGIEPGAAAIADQGSRGGRASPRNEGLEGARRGAEGRQETELTPQGEQVLIRGVPPVTDRDRLVMRAGDAAPPAGGLFDEGARAQGGLFDTPSVDESIPVGELVDADGGVVPRTATVRQLVDQLDDDQALATVLQACAP